MALVYAGPVATCNCVADVVAAVAFHDTLGDFFACSHSGAVRVGGATKGSVTVWLLSDWLR